MSEIMGVLLIMAIIYLFLKDRPKKKVKEKVDCELQEKINHAHDLLKTLPKEQKINKEAYDNVVKYSKYMLENFSDTDYMKYRDALTEEEKDEIHHTVFSSILGTSAYVQRVVDTLERRTNEDSWDDVEKDKKESLNQFLHVVEEETAIMSDFFRKFVRYF